MYVCMYVCMYTSQDLSAGVRDLGVQDTGVYIDVYVFVYMLGLYVCVY